MNLCTGAPMHLCIYASKGRAICYLQLFNHL